MIYTPDIIKFFKDWAVSNIPSVLALAVWSMIVAGLIWGVATL